MYLIFQTYQPTTVNMFSKVFLIALAASPLVSAHGKIAVMVSYRYGLLVFIANSFNRLVMLVETPLLLV